jgi:hypothetical protein
MKLQTRHTNTQVSGNTDAPRTFNINANELAFGVLSSGLYNDKIRAIIRELSCNAWDAHVMAGKKDVPFEIHLPTDFEPVFRITDYGTGLSHEDVMTLYCTYFASNKNQSNDVVGAMGLGSKSPFCYTQAMDEPGGFTVISRFDGMKRIYSAYVEGAPTIVCLSEEPTEEPNGLEVEFAVNTDDVWEFENKAKMALEFFSPMPKVNVDGFEANKQDYAIRTELWALRKPESNVHGLRAIQGMVQYNVGSIDMSRMDTQQQRAAELPLDLFFPIGELSVGASREMLSNDQRTIKNILNMLTNVYDGMVAETRKVLDTCEYAWQARLRLMVIMASDIAPLIEDAYNDGKFFGKYSKFTLTEAKPTLNELDYRTTQVAKFTRSGKKKALKTVLFKKYDEPSRQLAFEGIKLDAKTQANFLKEIEVAEKVIFILNDLGVKGTEKYIHAYVQGQDALHQDFCKIAYVFSVADNKSQLKRMKKEFKKAMNIIGNPPFITVSHLKENFQHLLEIMKPVPRPKVTGILQVTGTGRSYRSGANSGWMKHTWSRVPEADLPTGIKFYIPVENRRLADAYKHVWKMYDARDFVTFIGRVKASKLFPDVTAATPIFGLTEKAIDRKSDPNWVNILDYVGDNAQALISDAKVLELSIFLAPFECNHAEILQAMLKDEAAYAGSPLIEFAKAYFAVKGKKKEETATAISELIDTLTAIKKYKRGEVVNFMSLWKKIVTERYPLLGFNFNKFYGNTVQVSYEKSVLQYIKLMDAQQSVPQITEAI